MTSARPRLLALYAGALPAVYGYLLTRCGERHVAEDLTAETFLAAVDAVRRPTPPDLTVAWLIGVARHKLADHWRGVARDRAGLEAAGRAEEVSGPTDDPWGARLDRLVALQTLNALAPQHRLVLTLRYVDDLPVSAVANVVGRTVHATEGLLVRARRSFRRHYPADDDTGEGTTP